MQRLKNQWKRTGWRYRGMQRLKKKNIPEKKRQVGDTEECKDWKKNPWKTTAGRYGGMQRLKKIPKNDRLEVWRNAKIEKKSSWRYGAMQRLKKIPEKWQAGDVEECSFLYKKASIKQEISEKKYLFNLTWITNTDRRNTDDAQMREAAPQQAWHKRRYTKHKTITVLKPHFKRWTT